MGIIALGLAERISTRMNTALHGSQRSTITFRGLELQKEPLAWQYMVVRRWHRYWSNRMGSRPDPRPYSCSLCSKGGVYLGTGIQYAPDKENGACLNVADKKDEGAIYGDLQTRFGCC
jgi:hypothetical protein